MHMLVLERVPHSEPSLGSVPGKQRRIFQLVELVQTCLRFLTVLMCCSLAASAAAPAHELTQLWLLSEPVPASFPPGSVLVSQIVTVHTSRRG